MAPTAGAVERQRAFFNVLAEFFRRATGETIAEFAAHGDFGEVVRSRAAVYAPRGPKAFSWLEEQLEPFYSRPPHLALRDTAVLGGMKLVLGGSSRFMSPQLAGVRKMLLYTDTILIPDPILPWLESPRSEERFRNVNLLEAVFWLLHLKPLVDADLPYPAITVVPTYEHSLRRDDPDVQRRYNALINKVVGHHLNRSFDSFDELVSYVSRREAEFMQGVDSAKLLIGPGATHPEPLNIALARYREYVRTWRTGDHLAMLERLPPGHLVMNALVERFVPQCYMLDNAEAVAAQPMMCVPEHWYYYERLARATEGALNASNSLAPATVATLRSINEPGLQWLGNVPISDLVNLRQANENEHFRRQIETYTGSLHEATLSNLDRVAAEVGRGIATLIAEHQVEIKRIKEDYKLSHLQTLVASVTTAAALFVPALAPFMGTTAPLALAGKYTYDKVKQRHEQSRACRSLTGVLAVARENSQ